MTKAIGSEGPRAPLFCWVLLVAPGAMALAQSVEVAELARCAGLESDAMKLACFEAIVAAHSGAMPGEAEPQSELPQRELQAVGLQPAVHAAAAVDAEPKSPAVAKVETQAVAASSATALAQVAAAEVEAQPAASASVPAAAESPSQPATNMEGWGIRERREPDVVHASVVKVTKTRYGELVFHFDNGQVWRQQEKRYFPYPKDREFDVTISTGMMGEHRLQVEDAGRRATIKRLQ